MDQLADVEAGGKGRDALGSGCGDVGAAPRQPMGQGDQGGGGQGQAGEQGALPRLGGGVPPGTDGIDGGTAERTNNVRIIQRPGSFEPMGS